MAYDEVLTARRLEAEFDKIAEGGNKATTVVAEAIAAGIRQAFADAEVEVTIKLTDPATGTVSEQTVTGRIK